MHSARTLRGPLARSFKWRVNSRRCGSGQIRKNVRTENIAIDWWTLAFTLRSYKTLASNLRQRDMTLSALCPSPQVRQNRVSLGAEPTLVILGSALLLELSSSAR